MSKNSLALVADGTGQMRSLTATEMRAHVNLIQEVMQAVMKEGTHYGMVPGARKPSLWKAGAEVLCATFRVAPSYRIEDLSGPDRFRYRVTCIGTHQVTGIVLGEGVGACSTLEEKYKWRKAVSRQEFDATPEDRRRTKYGYDKATKREYQISQVRAESDDQDNTVIKMSCKRAQIAMTLNVLAASDIFTQDIEDLPEEIRDSIEGDNARTAQAVTQADPDKASEAARKHIATLIERAQQTGAWETARGYAATRYHGDDLAYAKKEIAIAENTARPVTQAAGSVNNNAAPASTAVVGDNARTWVVGDNART